MKIFEPRMDAKGREWKSPPVEGCRTAGWVFQALERFEPRNTSNTRNFQRIGNRRSDEFWNEVKL